MYELVIVLCCLSDSRNGYNGRFYSCCLITGFNDIAHILIVAILGMLVAIPEALFFSKKVGSITGDNV